jgi:hypothetical protein
MARQDQNSNHEFSEMNEVDLRQDPQPRVANSSIFLGWIGLAALILVLGLFYFGVNRDGSQTAGTNPPAVTAAPAPAPQRPAPAPETTTGQAPADAQAPAGSTAPANR